MAQPMTQQDTQPPAETLADRALAADILDEVSNLLDHNGIGQVADLIRDGMYDEHEVMGVISRHRLAALTRRAGGDAIPAGEDKDEFATVEEWEHEDQRQLSLLYNHKAHDRPQFNRSQMREAIRHGRRLATPKPPTSGDAGEWQRAAYASIAANKVATKLIDRMLASLGHMADGLADQKSSWADYARRLFAESQDTAHADRLAALALPAPVVEGEIVPPENGEPDPEWRAIKRAIDQFAGRVPTISKHRALNNAHIRTLVDRLDAAGDHEAADTIVWQCWWRALDRERERFLMDEARRNARAALSEGRSHG